jgi:Uma2 family endonuclease
MMDQTNPHRLLTVEDLYELPDTGALHELAAGALLSEPPPGGEHGRVEATLTILLGTFVRKRHLGVIYAGDTGFILARSPDTVRAPDLAFVTAERARALGRTPGHLPVAPDLAVEVVSPHDRPGDIHAKVADYLAAGTRLVWVLDPATECVRAYRSLFAPALLTDADELDGGDVVPGFRVKVSELFEDP